MPISDTSPKNKRANLFLLRLWCDGEKGNENEQGDRGEKSGLMWQEQWHGIVQRTVSGEEHSFDGIEGLIDVLEAMLYKGRPHHGGRQGETDPEVGHGPAH